jgi:hypothetical protein
MQYNQIIKKDFSEAFELTYKKRTSLKYFILKNNQLEYKDLKC